MMIIMKKTSDKEKNQNPMRKIRIEKIVLNIGCGKDKKIENAVKILEMTTKQKPVVIKTEKRTTFGVPKNKPIGVKVTIRKNCIELLKKLFETVENKIKGSCFDNFGNFAFGITEYIMIPGTTYDPKIEILGMDVCVTLERPGYRVRRKRLSEKIGKKHMITKQEATEFIKNNFDVKVE